MSSLATDRKGSVLGDAEKRSAESYFAGRNVGEKAFHHCPGSRRDTQLIRLFRWNMRMWWGFGLIMVIGVTVVLVFNAIGGKWE